MNPPCEADANSWTIGRDCPQCGHTGWMHKGAAGGSDMNSCLICATINLNDALTQREAELRTTIYETEQTLFALTEQAKQHTHPEQVTP